MEKWEIKLLKERVDTEFFVSPEGKVVRWEGTLKELHNYCSTHDLLASSLFPDSKHPTDVMHELGWIAIGSACYGNRIKGEPTQAQINTLDELGFHGIIDCAGVRHYWK